MDKLDFVQKPFEMPYDFGFNTTLGYREHNPKRQDRRLVSRYCTDCVQFFYVNITSRGLSNTPDPLTGRQTGVGS